MAGGAQIVVERFHSTPKYVLGRQKEARAEVAEIMRISPGASLENWRERLPYQQEATLDRYIGGLRKAGMK